MADPITFRLGEDCKAYYSSTLLGDGSSVDTLTWEEVEDIKGDVTITLEKSEVDITTRRHGKWDATAQRGISLGFEFQYQYNPENTAAFNALQSAFINNDQLAMLFLDAALIDDGIGPYANWDIGNFSRNEQSRNALVYDASGSPVDQHGWHN